jgi:hypothetical protein
VEPVTPRRSRLTESKKIASRLSPYGRRSNFPAFRFAKQQTKFRRGGREEYDRAPKIWLLF